MRVYVIAPESAVYHADDKCPALNRGDHYWPVSIAERMMESGEIFYTGGMHAGQKVKPRRRACRRCGVTDMTALPGTQQREDGS